MKNPFQKIASLRLAIAFALGILFANLFPVPADFYLIVALVITVCAVLIHLYYRYNFEQLFGWTVTILFAALGSLFYTNYNRVPQLQINGKFVATVLEASEEKPNSYKSLLKIDAAFRNDSIIPSKEQILVYFEQTEKAGQLKPGNTILFHKTPEIIENNGNPFEFDYKSYLAKKKIYRRIYLAESDWILGSIQKSSVKTIAEKYRNKLLAIYHKQGLGEKQTEILSALTLGYKRGLDPETKRIFSSAGAMHVLAVSGLHVGILFAMFTLFFGFMRKHKYGKFLFVLLGILVLWAYAFITGLSPSVMRAATMFSLVCVASNISRRANIYNTLSFSALVLLIINPNNLFEVGFQLSYSAVFGIVFLQPKLDKLWPVKNKMLHFFWSLLTVSIAAQIATFPITSYYFNQFPSYFWISNLLVIPAVFLLISLGISLLVFSAVPFLNTFLAFVTKWTLKFVYLFLAGIEDLPFSVTEISFTKTELLFLILTILFFFSFIEFKKIRSLKAMFVALVLFATSSLVFNFRNLQTTELIIYNNARNLTAHLITGRTNYVISEHKIDSTDYVLRQIETVRKKKQLNDIIFISSNDSIYDQHLYYRNNVLKFEGKLIWFRLENSFLPKTIHPSLIVTSRNFSEENLPPSTIPVISNYNYSNLSNLYSLKEKGAYQIKWAGKLSQKDSTTF